MALVDTTWYCNFGNGTSTGYYAVTVRPQNTAVAAGVLRRQFTTPTVGNERVFVCIVAGTTANVTDATWVLTRGAKTIDGTATWQEVTGQPSVNGDLTNTATWAQVKAATPAVLGQIIKRSNNASYQICTTAGAMSASEPAFSDTAGVTTTDTTAVWTSLGAVSNFTGGQAPFARFGAPLLSSNTFVSGNTMYVGSNHAETQSGSITITSATSSTPIAKIICHNYAGSYPPAAGDITTGASITSTGAATTITLSMTGSYYFYGIAFTAATSGAGTIILNASATVSLVHNWHTYDNCSFALGTITGTSYVQAGPTAAASWGITIFDNCKLKFLEQGQTLALGIGQFTWRNTGQVLLAGSSVPGILLKNTVASTGYLSTVTLEGLDLSQLTGTLFSNIAASSSGSLLVKDCKLNAAMSTPTLINTGMTVQLAASASDATSYKSSRHTYEATETTETSIVRTGGYQDPAGQMQSRKIVTTANAQWLRPYAAQPLAVWNDDVGSPKTVTVYGTVSGGALPTNDEIWLEVSGLTNASFPVGSMVTSGKANVWSTGSAGVSDSSTWPSTTVDSDFSSVKLLLGFEGTNASTGAPGMTDESSSVRGNATIGGNAQISTAQSKFGGSSLLLDGAGDFISFPNSTDWSFGSGPFTIECFVYAVSLPTSAYIVARWPSGSQSFGFYHNSVDGLNWVISTNGSNFFNDIVSNSMLTTGIWYHVVMEYDGTKYRLYKNGVMVGSSTTPRAMHASTGTLAVGYQQNNTNYWNGYIDEVRITKGVARYASDSGFTVPTAAYPRALAWTPFKLVATLTPNMAGYLIPQVKVAKTSSTIYIDPLAVVT